jgi:hypothetical protein
MKARLLAGVVAMIVAVACGGDSPTTPTTVVSTTSTVTFVTTVPVAGSRFYSFTVSTAGTVTAMLASVASPTTGAPLAAPVEMSIGVPAGTDCAGGQSVTAEAALGVQLTSSLAAGVYCLRLADAGFLRSPARVAARFTYP